MTLHRDAPSVTLDVGTGAMVDLWGIRTMMWFAIPRDQRQRKSGGKLEAALPCFHASTPILSLPCGMFQKMDDMPGQGGMVKVSTVR